jgi:hypothetical protein
MKPIQTLENLTLIEENQAVGDGFGMMYFRNLYKTPEGKYVSIPKTHPIDIQRMKESGKSLEQVFSENLLS